MEIRFWQPYRRPAQDQVPAHVRKIWLARDCFEGHEDARRTTAAQELLHAGPDALVLRGRSRLRTRPHASFAREDLEPREQQLLLWVPFRSRFSEIPAVSVTLAEEKPYDIRAVQVAPEGFQIMLQHWGEIPEPHVDVTWRAAGFPDPVALRGATP